MGLLLDESPNGNRNYSEGNSTSREHEYRKFRGSCVPRSKPSYGVFGFLGFWRRMGYDEDEPVWPTWAVGTLFRGARCIHIDHVFAQLPLI
jgi:hypothetical protein